MVPVLACTWVVRKMLSSSEKLKKIPIRWKMTEEWVLQFEAVRVFVCWLFGVKMGCKTLDLQSSGVVVQVVVLAIAVRMLCAWDPADWDLCY